MLRMVFMMEMHNAHEGVQNLINANIIPYTKYYLSYNLLTADDLSTFNVFGKQQIDGRATDIHSTEFGSICQDCERPKDQFTFNPSANLKDGLKTVRVSSTNKGRKGKPLTLIRD